MDILKLFICVFVTSFFCYLQIRQFKAVVERVTSLENEVEDYRQLTIKANGEMRVINRELQAVVKSLPHVNT